jgi:hypothetical protein
VPSNVSTEVSLRLLYSTVLQCVHCPQIVHESWWIQSLEDAIIHVAQNILIDFGAIWLSRRFQPQIGIRLATCKPSIP